MNDGRKNKIPDEYKLKLKSIGILSICLITYVFLLININSIGSFLGNINKVLTPFIIGFVFAYLMNPLIKWIKKAIKKVVKKDCSHGFAMFISYILIGILIIFLILNIFPQIGMSIDVIVKEIPTSISEGIEWLETDGDKYIKELTGNRVSSIELLEKFNIDMSGLIERLTGSLGTIINVTAEVFVFIINTILGVLISIYMLMHKEKYLAQIKKSIFAFMDKEKAEKTLKFWKTVHITFSRFITARIIDSTIIGIICYIGCLILGFDNSMLIAFVVGVTNVIPYFGPFIGAIPCALIVLLQGPTEMFMFVIFILILQQFDGNILGPKLLGDSLGLTSLWIIFAVAITTKLIGLVGMVIGVPLFAIIYMMIKDKIYTNLEKRGLSKDTEDYRDKE